MDDIIEIFIQIHSYLPITRTPIINTLLTYLFKKNKEIIKEYKTYNYILNIIIIVTNININIIWFLIFQYLITSSQYKNIPFDFRYLNINYKEIFIKYPNSITNTITSILFLISINQLYKRKYIISIIFLTLSNYMKFYIIFIILFIIQYLYDLSNRKENNFKFFFIFFLYSLSLLIYLFSIYKISQLPYFNELNNKNLFNYLKDNNNNNLINEYKIKYSLINNEFTNEFKQISLSNNSYEPVLDRSKISLKTKLGYITLNKEEYIEETTSDDNSNDNSNIIKKKEKKKIKTNTIKITKKPTILKITKLHNYVYNNFYKKAYKELFIKNGDEIKISFEDKILTVKNSEKRFSEVKFIKKETNKYSRFIVETINTNEIFSMKTYFKLKNSGKYLSVTKNKELKLSFYGKKSNIIFSVEENQINNIFKHHKFNKIKNYSSLKKIERFIEYLNNIFFNENISFNFLSKDFTLIFFNFYLIFKFLFLNLIQIRYKQFHLNNNNLFYFFISILFLLNFNDGKFLLFGIWVLKEMSLKEITLLSIIYTFIFKYIL